MFRFFKRPPDMYVGGRDNPYMLRWYIIPRNRWLNIYLHKFLRDDEDRALHDHPWWFLSLMIRGRYLEWTPCTDDDHPLATNVGVMRYAPSLAFRRATHTHRIELPKDKAGNIRPTWTLVLTGRRVREWGFHCPQGWRHWREFLSPKDEGATGRGCD